LRFVPAGTGETGTVSSCRHRPKDLPGLDALVAPSSNSERANQRNWTLVAGNLGQVERFFSEPFHVKRRDVCGESDSHKGTGHGLREVLASGRAERYPFRGLNQRCSENHEWNHPKLTQVDDTVGASRLDRCVWPRR